ncbi:hypothetical protein BAE44_0006434 [Dichanthelium oligosanthes]|uniref:Myb-like domain-containing protein n=1 Tax=Dichanthelium oligosanthes TaxID=888268 RepID=A0A1E5W552_9POAL|nr:hypothetical protein BAE44_0006434 [Dichanthelium oligosanthes]
MEGGSRALLGQARDEQSRNVAVASAGALTVARDYRRGNWTLPETMLLIEAKRKVHEERHPGDQGLARWRWVEDYCWRAGCRRSQNQCNDRWDNLMRDYKKVRAHELAGAGAGRAPSYWAMGRAERKGRGLPSNLLREIYDAMGEVIDRRMSMGCGGSGGGGGAGGAFVGASSSLLDVPMQASPLAQVLPRPLPLEQETPHHGHGAAHFGFESPERKRRRPSLDELRPGSSTPSSAPGTHGHRQEQGHHHREDEYDHGDDDESSGSEYSDDDGEVLSGAIGRCAAILSEALESREAAEERRHREVMAVEERRGRARRARREAGEQCVAGLAAAVNQLAGSMLALAAAKHKDKGGGPAAPK